MLTAKQIRKLIELTKQDDAVRKILREDVLEDATRKEFGYSQNHGPLQTSLSIMLQAAENRENATT